MKKLNKPQELAKDVFTECIGNFRAKKKRALSIMTNQVANSASDYDIKASSNQLHNFPLNTGLTAKDIGRLKSVYSEKLSKKGQPGRWLYDKIILSAPGAICPLCGKGHATTVDHVLPKSKYSLLSVVPFNLIPACQECNTGKSDFIPKTAGELHIHPYYDDVEGETWLRADVIQTAYPSLSFSTVAVPAWSALLNQRVEFHFSLFDLSKLYGIHSSSELNGTMFYYKKLYADGGRNAVQEYLTHIANSHAEENKNSWRTAMYNALAQSNWFCSTALQ